VKAILVLEMPSSCGECSICASWQESAFSTREYWCPSMDNKDVEPNTRPDWCPLRPVPEKRQTTDDFWQGCVNIVRNHFIDEILGDKE
jgi:hypothetical protein